MANYNGFQARDSSRVHCGDNNPSRVEGNSVIVNLVHDVSSACRDAVGKSRNPQSKRVVVVLTLVFLVVIGTVLGLLVRFYVPGNSSNANSNTFTSSSSVTNAVNLSSSSTDSLVPSSYSVTALLTASNTTTSPTAVQSSSISSPMMVQLLPVSATVTINSPPISATLSSFGLATLLQAPVSSTTSLPSMFVPTTVSTAVRTDLIITLAPSASTTLGTCSWGCPNWSCNNYNDCADPFPCVTNKAGSSTCCSAASCVVNSCNAQTACYSPMFCYSGQCTRTWS